MVIRDEKHFYAQVVCDFYEDSRLQYLESQPDGMMYSFFYTRLMLKSVKTEGRLRVSDKVTYNDAMLARVTGMGVEIVRPAMELLEELGLVERQEDGTIYIPEVPKMVASESRWADYKRKQRSKDNVQEMSNECPTDVQQQIGHCPIGTETKTNTKTETKTERISAPAALRALPAEKSEVKKKYGSYGWVELTEKEHAQLLDELGEAELARCVSYIDESAQSTGNRNRWRDWKLVLQRCSRESWGVKQEKPQAQHDRRTVGYYPEEQAGECSEEEKQAAANDMENLRKYLAKLKEGA